MFKGSLNMAKKNVQPAESDVEIITPDVDKKEKKNAKVDNSKQKNKSNKKQKTEKKSLKNKIHITINFLIILLQNLI